MRVPRIKPRFNAKSLAVIAIVTGALLAITLPGEAQVSADSPSVAAIRIESPATLDARGAALSASVLVVCPAGNSAFVSIFVTERVGGDIASGNGSTQFPCTGGLQTVDLSVFAQNSPFRKGTAFAAANIFGSGLPGGDADDQREIEIVR